MCVLNVADWCCIDFIPVYLLARPLSAPMLRGFGV